MRIAEEMKKFIITILKVLVVSMAILMTIGVIGIFGLQLRCWPYFLFIAVVVYKLFPRKWGEYGISFLVIVFGFYLLIMLLSGFFLQPLYVIMSSMLAIAAVLLLQKCEPLWVKGLITLLFLGYGVYYVYNNDIIGPTTFMIMDRPIDTPAQWNHCYRLFWTGTVIETVCYRIGMVSVIFLLARNSRGLFG